MPSAELCEVQSYAKCRIMQSAVLCKVQSDENQFKAMWKLGNVKYHAMQKKSYFAYCIVRNFSEVCTCIVFTFIKRVFGHICSLVFSGHALGRLETTISDGKKLS